MAASDIAIATSGVFFLAGRELRVPQSRPASHVLYVCTPHGVLVGSGTHQGLGQLFMLLT
jgi:hypothetical protein